jgi:hypothetical protein
MRSKTQISAKKPMKRVQGLASRGALLTAAVVLGAACSSDGTSGTPGAAGSSANPPPGAGTAGTPVSMQGAGAGGGPAAVGGAPSSGSGAGGVVSNPSGGSAGVPASAGAAGFTLPTMTNSDHCLYGYNPMANDATMASGPVKFSTSMGQTDTSLQPEVLQWMADNKWTGAHVIWHAVRGCTDGTAGGLLGPLGLPNLCKDYPVLIPSDQNCKTAGDGYQFLLFHRHMLQTLKQLWPKHAADFAGFPTFPKTAAEVPDAFTAPTWSATILAAAEIGDNIAKPENLAKFPSEGVLGHWLQCNVGAAKLAAGPDVPYIGLHFDLHGKWARVGSKHGLNDGQVNITNYMFWKLHGWIDNVWEKYRVAKGLTTDPMAMQKYKQDLKQSCNEMDIEVEILKKNGNGTLMLDCPPDVDEKGDFHTKVRPLFESDSNRCASCHGPSQSSPYANLTLGGAVSSKCVVERLKAATLSGGQFKLVEPGDPDKSWLYLKASGKAATAGCTSSDPNKPCNAATMPPSGKTMTDAELTILYDWIKAGAAGPT